MVGLRSGLGMAVPLSGGGAAYWQKLASYFDVGLWRLNETSGANAADISPNANDGTYINTTLANAAGPDGILVPLFNGTSARVNLNTAAFWTDFNALAGNFSINVWGKVSAAGVWTDSTIRNLIGLLSNAGSIVDFRRTIANNTLSIRYRGATQKNVDITTTTTAWFSVGMSINTTGNQMKVYWQGSQSGATQTGFGAWAGGDWTNADIGSFGASQWWSGWEGLLGISSSILNDAQFLDIATP